MSEKTGISWCDHTHNHWIGCAKVSAGCAHCYAETQNARYNWTGGGWGKGQPRKLTSQTNRAKPYTWARNAVKEGVTRRVFCSSLADVFDPEVPQRWREELWALIDGTGEVGGLEWLLLTKRIKYAGAMLPLSWLQNPPPYVRLGVTTEDQPNAEKRLPALLHVWRGKNFVSYEPALGAVDFSPWLDHVRWPINPTTGAIMRPVDWLICGGESGAGCRKMSLEWARSARDQCAAAGVPFFFKQLGGYPDKRHDPAQWPEDLRVQQFPEGL